MPADDISSAVWAPRWFLAVRADVVKLFNKSDHDSETKPDMVPGPGGPTLAILLEPNSLAPSSIICTGTL